MSIADNPIFHDAEAAREWLERLLWPEGPICPHCGLIGAAYKLNGKKQRAGLYECKGCAEQFTVTVGTVCERSHIPLNKWVLAFHLIVASKKGISAHQMHRMLGMTYKSAWFMCHRIREALASGKFPTQLGGQNKVVEADETYIGGKEANKHAWKRTPGRQGGVGKAPVLALVEREGTVRSQHVANVNAKTLGPVLAAHIHKATYVMTDEAPVDAREIADAALLQIETVQSSFPAHRQAFEDARAALAAAIAALQDGDRNRRSTDPPKSPPSLRDRPKR